MLVFQRLRKLFSDIIAFHAFFVLNLYTIHHTLFIRIDCSCFVLVRWSRDDKVIGST